MTKSKPPRHVALAIVYCEATHRVLMVTSRKHPHLWILPKGGVEQGETPGQAAVRESHEEAGSPANLRAPDESDEITTIDLPVSPHQKRAAVWHVHSVHMHAETDLLPTWLEERERKREWVSPKQALGRIQQWYTDSSGKNEIDIIRDAGEEVIDEGSSSASSSILKTPGKGLAVEPVTKKGAKGCAMERSLRAFAEVYGWE